MKIETKALHVLPTDPLTGAISVPIYQTATFVQDAPGENKGYDYSRSNNPTRAALELLIAKLENGDAGYAFSSGLAAVDAVLKLLNYGDEILATDDIYGGTFRAFEKVYEKFGIKVNYVDTSNLNLVQSKINSKTKFIWIESPSNPLLKINDIKALADIAHLHQCLLVVDNTFLSPAGQRPLELGADIVIHSATKYIAGHSDVIAGLVVTKDADLSAKIKFYQNATGAVLGPFDSWLTIRGIQTLQIRIEKQCGNALSIAKYLEKEDLVAEVFYPGLENHKGHELALKQQETFGAIISFRLKDDSLEDTLLFLSKTKYFKLAESLGGVKSLICHPSSMTHKTIPKSIREKNGITDGLIRVSCGIENIEDLILDLAGAFTQLKEAKLSQVSFA
ncbi:MAG: PLP-dependent aspartate aminotransferase family protein [Bacteroidota bacterium]